MLIFSLRVVLDFEKIKRLEKYSFGQRGYDISTGIESHNEKDFNKMTQILKF